MAKGTIKHHVQTELRIRRGYFECRYGQLHVRNAIPPGGGFDEGTPLIALHGSTESSAAFERFLPLMGRDRSVYAPDLPGFGESDPPPAAAAIADYAAAVADFCDSMRFRQIDVLGHGSGSLVSAELALSRAGSVRRVVCAGLPVISDAEREALRRSPWPLPPTEDGRFLGIEWERTRSGAQSLSGEMLARSFAEKIGNGNQARRVLQAACEYPARDRLARLAQPVLILRPHDVWKDATLRARELVPRARFVELPGLGDEAFRAAPEQMVDTVRDFVRG